MRNDAVLVKDLVDGGQYYTGNSWVQVISVEAEEVHMMRVTFQLLNPTAEGKHLTRSMYWDRCWHLTDRGRDLYADEVTEVLAKVTDNPYCPFPPALTPEAAEMGAKLLAALGVPSKR